MKTGSNRAAICIGGGPAGLTAAYELLRRTAIVPLVLERDAILGGIARTVNYKGNRIDLGGHRFFSKSDRVMRWWFDLMPPEAAAAGRIEIAYQGSRREVDLETAGPDPATDDEVMLIRSRKSRIYFLRRFFDYPISLSANTLRNLGLVRVARIGFSYLRARLRPIREEKSLEDFLINRFGRELYGTFFEDYTEKVWGVPCSRIDPEWGAQRIKGLSIRKVVLHALARPFRRGGVSQKSTETSLIERFLYPKLGPGQMWELCARQVREMGGQVELRTEVERIHVEGKRVVAVTARDRGSGGTRRIEADHFFSTMPVRDLVRALDCEVPGPVREIAEGLVYRDFLTVGLLLEELKVEEPAGGGPLKDNWIYIQEPEVKIGRLQIFNNWSPFMVADRSRVWVGLEYFCDEGDDLWGASDEELIALGRRELARIGIIEESKVLDGTVLRMPKTYPAYFGTYDRFDELRQWLDTIENLFLIGRNGMHRYNNQDHSMLAAMVAVDNIVEGRVDKTNIWDVNAEREYHESKED